MLRTVRARLTVITILIVAVILALMGFLVRARVQANLIGEIDRQLWEDVSSVKTGSPGSEPDLKGIRRDVRPLHTGEVPHAISSRMTEVLRSNDAEVRLDASWNPPKLIPAEEVDHPLVAIDDPTGLRLAANGPSFHEFTKGAVPMRSLTAPIRKDGRLIAYIQASRPLVPVRHQMADLDRALQTSIPIAILLAALGGALLVGNAIRPLRRMNIAARQLDRDLASVRLPVEGKDEFADLAESINAAFDEQRRALAQLERFSGDAGHELRTPLAAIKTNASFLLHLAGVPPQHLPALRSIDASADRMAKLIGDLLLLARQDAGQRLSSKNKTPIKSLICNVLESLTPPRAEVEIRVDPSVEAEIDADAVERVVLNLLSNALRYACRIVVVSGEIQGDELVVTVRDDGGGIAPEHLPRLGERFFRPDESRSREGGGVGLGLAIARSLAESHGGSLTIQSQVGQGTTAAARFRVAS